MRVWAVDASKLRASERYRSHRARGVVKNVRELKVPFDLAELFVSVDGAITICFDVCVPHASGILLAHARADGRMVRRPMAERALRAAYWAARPNAQRARVSRQRRCRRGSDGRAAPMYQMNTLTSPPPGGKDAFP